MRLTEVIREECLSDGPGAYAAFKDMATLEAEYPKVADAIQAEAELRPTMGGARGVLEKIARPAADEILGGSDPPVPGDPDEHEGQKPE